MTLLYGGLATWPLLDYVVALSLASTTSCYEISWLEKEGWQKTDFPPTLLSMQLEIKNHVFFSPINWDDLYHKRITPPFNPNVVSGCLCGVCRIVVQNGSSPGVSPCP